MRNSIDFSRCTPPCWLSPGFRDEWSSFEKIMEDAEYLYLTGKIDWTRLTEPQAQLRDAVRNGIQQFTDSMYHTLKTTDMIDVQGHEEIFRVIGVIWRCFDEAAARSILRGSLSSSATIPEIPPPPLPKPKPKPDRSSLLGRLASGGALCRTPKQFLRRDIKIEAK